jgi:LuxR family quorum-sensing system transcriptional regulator CciR
MSQLVQVTNFVSDVSRVTRIDDLRVLLDRVVREIGFDYYALVHHVDDRHVALRGARYVRLINYPVAFGQAMGAAYFADDPVAAACQKSAAPFVWTDIPLILTLTPRQQDILQAATDAGVGDGFTVPIHVPGEATGSCSFSTRLGRSAPNASFASAHYLGCFAFEAARRIVHSSSNGGGAGSARNGDPRLTRRQLDCIVLAGRGKSDRDIGQLLGISENTVNQHIEQAKRRYEVSTRMQLVIRALFDGAITFPDLVDCYPVGEYQTEAGSKKSTAEEPVSMAKLSSLFFDKGALVH